MVYYQRKIEEKINKELENKDIIILTGMRRVGKTSFFKEIFRKIKDNKIWFDFENPLQVRIFEDLDYDDIYETLATRGLDKDRRMHIFIDEAQNYPDISKVAKYLHDHYDIKFYLTGSASFYLKNLFSESLAGRKKIFELFPLSFEEFLLFKGANVDRFASLKNKAKIKEVEYEEFDSYYSEYLEWGGFPQAVLEKEIDAKLSRLEEIFSSYWQKEVIGLADYRKNDKVRELILLLAARVGSRLDIIKLSQILKITRPTVYSYLSFLEASYLISLIQPYSGSIDREIAGAAKLYFCDNGLLKVFTRLNDGQILENAVYNQLRGLGKVNYFKKRNSGEIDFILDKKQAYEVKKTATLSDQKELERRMSNLKMKKGYVVSRNFTDSLDKIKFAQFV